MGPFQLSENRNGLLSNEQREFYERNGYLVIPDLVEWDLIQDVRQRFLDICDGRVPKGQITMMKDVSLMKQGVTTGERLVNKLQDICYDDVLFKYISHPRVLDYTEAFIGKNILAMHTMMINKPPDSGALTSRHPLHQDLHYFPFRPASRIICSWTALEHIHNRNGCLVVVPGSHTMQLREHKYPEWEGGVNKMYHGIQDPSLHGRTVELEMHTGDTVFFHPLLIHGSGPNMTTGFRKAISSHYAADDCHYIDVEGTIQSNIADEVKNIMAKRGVDMTFEDLWRFRAVLVRGIRHRM